MKKYILYVYMLVVLVTLFVFTTSASELTLSIFEILMTSFTALVVYLMLDKFKRIRKEVFIVFVGLLFWLLGDVVNMASLFYSSDHFLHTIVPYLYEMPSVCFALSATIYFFHNIREWHKFQLLIDGIYVVTTFLIIFYVLLSEYIDLSGLSMAERAMNLMFILSNVIMLVAIFILISSKRAGKINKLLISYILAFILYVVIELVYVYVFLSGNGFRPNWLGMLYIGVQALLGLSSLIFNEEDRTKDPVQTVNAQFENIGKSYIGYVLMSISLVLFFSNIIEFRVFIHVIVITVIYLVVGGYLKNLFRAERLLEKERVITNNLEGIIKDRTKRLIDMNNRLMEQSVRDSLTGLYNRSHFFDTLTQYIELEQPFSLLYLDLNRFKAVNDLHGHSVGDRVVQAISSRLNDTSCNRCQISRVGGDEFCVILDTIELNDIQRVSENLSKLVKKEIRIDDYRFNLSVSIGVARYPIDAKTSNEMVQHADIAMYHAKRNKDKQEVYIYDHTLVDQIDRRNRIEWLLKTIDYDEEFEVYYQPQYDAGKDQLIGVEALIRWHSKELGWVSPLEFITIAEETNSILEITYWVVKQAFRQIAKWNGDYGLNMTMGINISPICFDAVDFLSNIENGINLYGVEPSWLDFEITEHSAITAIDNMIPIFDDLRELGIKISIDDFGTGYSSLSYLKRFNINRIKIAKELVDNIVSDHSEQIIVKAIVMISNELNLSVIAEGVEDKDQLDVLTSIGCHEIQGYYYGKPMAGHEFEKTFLKNESLM